MRRLFIDLVLGLTAVVDDGFADLAVGVPHEAISQGFWQGAGGVAGAAEAEDQFGLNLINSDD